MATLYTLHKKRRRRSAVGAYAACVSRDPPGTPPPQCIRFCSTAVGGSREHSPGIDVPSLPAAAAAVELHIIVIVITVIVVVVTVAVAATDAAVIRVSCVFFLSELKVYFLLIRSSQCCAYYIRRILPSHDCLVARVSVEFARVFVCVCVCVCECVYMLSLASAI
ncbi:hypothetical protein QTP88_004987 [Uroleucon formosanum]